VTIADHTPSRNCYLHGCRLPECELENYRYAKQLKLEHQRGEHRRQDVAEVRAHIQQLLDNNWWLAEIARASGVPSSNLQKLLTVSKSTHRNTARAILAVSVVPILRTPLGDRVHALGSMRRLRALAWLGHPWMDVGQYAGMTPDRLGVIANERVEVIRPDEARKISAAFRSLSTKPGRMKQIATWARNQGWHGPLAWDDIDDPACEPETDGIDELAASRKRKVYADPARVARLTAQGMSAEEIAQRIGCHKRTVVRARGRAADRAVAA
jgi:hypothetical protein